MTLDPPEVLILLIDSGLLVLIWLVQVVIYPGFQRIEATVFKDAHRSYTKAMARIVGPLMLAQLGLSAYLCVRNASPENILLVLLVTATWASTAILSVPLHRRLERDGKSDETIHRLVQTNWPRTALWTLIPALRMATVLPSTY